MKAWMTAIGMTTGAATYRIVTEQTRRVCACRLTFFYDDAHREIRQKCSFVDPEISIATLRTQMGRACKIPHGSPEVGWVRRPDRVAGRIANRLQPSDEGFPAVENRRSVLRQEVEPAKPAVARVRKVRRPRTQG